jgi:CRISPR-associated protein Cas2
MPRLTSAAAERWYIVTYDIADQKRWRRVFRLMKGHGRWLQLSVFQCRLTPRRRAEMAARLERWIKRDEDHVLIIDLGPAEGAGPSVESLGKPFVALKREAVVI